jgi:hypothetical protein
MDMPIVVSTSDIEVAEGYVMKGYVPFGAGVTVNPKTCVVVYHLWCPTQFDGLSQSEARLEYLEAQVSAHAERQARESKLKREQREREKVKPVFVEIKGARDE